MEDAVAAATGDTWLFATSRAMLSEMVSVLRRRVLEIADLQLHLEK